MSTFLRDQENAVDTASSRDRLSSLSTDQHERIRDYLLGDSYAFTKVVCGHRDLIPEFHMPLSYVICGLPAKLVPLLNDESFNSETTRVIRRELWRRGIDWNTPEGFAKLDDLLDFVNIRVYRGSFKSSIGTHGGVLFTATRDPNETIWVVSNSDENARAFAEQIRDTILENPVYQALFPERIPTGNIKELITQKRITLGGRTISHPQTNIEADGYLTKRISAHFSTVFVDDLVVKENSTPAAVRTVKAWLAGLPGFEMATRRTRRVHIGTIYAEDDDNKFLKSGANAVNCLTLHIPIETYEHGTVENILLRGTPTNPRLHPAEKIQKIQDKILADTEEGPISWRCNYLLDASAGGASIFPYQVVHDAERSYVKVTPKVAVEGRWHVARPKRDAEGNKVVRLDWKGAEDDPKRFLWITRDPFKEMDRVLTVDPSWVEGGDNWAVSCTGDDCDGVRYQLETQSGVDGTDGWVDAVMDMAAYWKVRLIGFDANANQDTVIKQMLRTDPRLKRIRSLFVPVKAQNITKKARIKNFVAEPLKMYRILLDPDDTVTKGEMTGYRGDKNATDGIVDSLAMAQAVHVRRSSTEEQSSVIARLRMRSAAITRSIDPYTGIPMVAA